MSIEKKSVGPLVLEPVQSERIWGVTSLEPWFDKSNLPEPVGEMWLTAENCKIASGPLQGKTLQDASPDFPLLMKILFPADKLSVQVHPDDAQAQAIGEPRGKTECWYVLSADPGATVAIGFREDLSVEDVRRAIENGTLEDKMAHLPVKAGDMVFVDAGTVHAIGPGVIILETQEYSDITYRLFDYGRPRELHLEKGLAVTRTKTAAGLVKPREVEGHTELIRSNYFVVDRLDMLAERSIDLGHKDKLQILVALAEGCTLIAEDGTATVLPKSHAVVLPAEGIGYSILGGHEAEVIRIRP
jgi:mannose-6-phosphate isomerase